jgi:hypothetical protein
MSLRTRGSRFKNFKSVWLTIEGFMTARYPALSIKGLGFNNSNHRSGVWVFDTFHYEQPRVLSETLQVLHEGLGIFERVYL